MHSKVKITFRVVKVLLILLKIVPICKKYVKSELFLDKYIQLENFKLGLLYDFFQMYV